MPLRNLLVIFLSAIISLACYLRADRNRYASTLAEAMNLISFNYLEEVGYRELYENAMEGMTERLDPYSSYISPSDYRYLKEELDQEFGGIGILVEYDRETGRLTVMSPLVDTPAARAGVKAGDIILAIDGQDTAGMSFRDAVELIRGKPGELVRLTVLHVGEDDPVELEIERAIIPIESVLGDVRRQDGTWEFQLEDDPRITYVRLITFGEITVGELAGTLEDRDVQALILDLRDNAGGLLTAAVGVSDLFIEQGTIVSIRGRSREIRPPYKARSDMLFPRDVPMAVLVNGFTASASEIVAACLQDHGRAKIIGQRTWGKGTVQNIIDLEGGRAALKLTTASYWRPSGKNIHRLKDADEEDDWGVRPDEGFEIKLTDEQADTVRKMRRARDTLPGAAPPEEQPEGGEGEGEPFQDPQLQRAIEYLQQRLEEIEPASQREAA
jgi:carboxyl-terminal processing protease